MKLGNRKLLQKWSYFIFYFLLIATILYSFFFFSLQFLLNQPNWSVASQFLNIVKKKLNVWVPSLRIILH